MHGRTPPVRMPHYEEIWLDKGDSCQSCQSRTWHACHHKQNVTLHLVTRCADWTICPPCGWLGGGRAGVLRAQLERVARLAAISSLTRATVSPPYRLHFSGHCGSSARWLSWVLYSPRSPGLQQSLAGFLCHSFFLSFHTRTAEVLANVRSSTWLIISCLLASVSVFSISGHGKTVLRMLHGATRWKLRMQMSCMCTMLPVHGQ